MLGENEAAELVICRRVVQVAAFETYAAFSGSSSAALAPGTVAVASCEAWLWPIHP